MEPCSVYNFAYQAKSDHVNSVKYPEKLGQYVCRKCNFYMSLSAKNYHPSSDEYRNNQRHPDYSETILFKTGLFMDEKTYVKYKFIPNESIT